MRKRVKPLIDRLLALTISKKLSVWVVGVVLEFMGLGISTNLLILSGIYLSVQGIWDILHSKIKAETSDPFAEVTYPEDPINFEK